MIYYIADLHLGHSNVLKLSNRPFSTIEEHDKYLIDTWNATVSKKDDIYIVGDLAYKNKDNLTETLKQLKGRKHLIIGNHDSTYLKKLDCKDDIFKSINQMTKIKDGDKHVVLCHYPMLEWSGYFKGWYHVHGHVHNNRTNLTFEFLRKHEKILNAGVDINKFKPVTLKELIENNKRFKTEKQLECVAKI